MGRAQSPALQLSGKSGAEIYRTACAPEAVVALPTPPPDFSDCKVATSEPDIDWHAVTVKGGPARAFGERMPAFGQALSEVEIQKALDHLRGQVVTQA